MDLVASFSWVVELSTDSESNLSKSTRLVRPSVATLTINGIEGRRDNREYGGYPGISKNNIDWVITL